MGKILVIDDDLSLREMLEMMLRGAGHQVTLAEDGLVGFQKGQEGPYDVIISDIKMPGLSGLDVLKRLRAERVMTPLVLMSAYAKPDTAVEAMREGAFDFVPKPFKPQDLLTVVDSALAHHNVEQERRALAEMVAANQRFGRMVGAAPAMMHVYDMVKRAAQTSTSILITGESGTGKEMVAKSVHENSDRADQAFVAINCGGMPENLVESELFGHKKGSFTGATNDKKGLVSLADGGTLFLDELGELTLPMQVKLLRVIQEKTFRPVGGDKEEHSDVRFISATNRNLESEIMNGNFREDLYYRLNVINIHLPPLRERAEDIPLLAHFFLEKYSKAQNKDVRKLSGYALDILSRYHFPGNVRELENIIERSVALEQSSIILPESLRLADFKRAAAVPGVTGHAAPQPQAMPPLSAFSSLRPGGAPAQAAFPPFSASFQPPLQADPASSNPAHFPTAFPAPQAPAFQHNFNPEPVAAHQMSDYGPQWGAEPEGLTILPGLPHGGIDTLIAELEVYYLYRALMASAGGRGRTATALAISPWRLRTRLVAHRLADLSNSRLTSLGESRFPKPVLPEGLAPDWVGEDINLDEIFIAVERYFIKQALTASCGNKTEAAGLLGLSRRSFQHRLEKTQYVED